MRMIKLIRLDRRMNGFGRYSHRADIKFDSSSTNGYVAQATTLYKIREWLWNKYGAGCELIIAARMSIKTGSYPEWAWDTEHGHMRIYLKEAALTEFLLVKERFERDE